MYAFNQLANLDESLVLNFLQWKLEILTRLFVRKARACATKARIATSCDFLAVAYVCGSKWLVWSSTFPEGRLVSGIQRLCV